jgi:hypothetical protein
MRVNVRKDSASCASLYIIQDETAGMKSCIQCRVDDPGTARRLKEQPDTQSAPIAFRRKAARKNTDSGS